MKAIFALCLSLALASVVIAAEDDKKVYTDPADVPASYHIQGEYEGVANPDNEKYGAQIIALGNEKFRLVAYKGGLPSETVSHNEPHLTLEGKLASGAATFQHKEVTIAVGGGRLEVTKDGEVVASVPRVERRSKTLGEKPPQGATVLFDGTDASAFHQAKVDDGLLLANCFTNDKFGDHRMHIEFRTPFKPTATGQARGNSGVYVQSRYEIQVLDSFGLSGESNECGGIYQIAKPAVNMCYPPLTWQTYDIDFTAAKYDAAGKKTKNARITVKHNGVVIHDDLELPNHTPGRHQESPEPDGLYLQGHGNPVYYRNIWVVKND